MKRINMKTNISLLLVLSATAGSVFGAEETGKTFATPEAAVAALEAAVTAKDVEAFRGIFGPAAEELQNPDRIQATNEWCAFSTALQQAKRIVKETDARCVLEVGTDNWPFPVPLVQKDNTWFFDTEAGKDEVLSRRIGRNELMTLSAVRAYVEAQRDYAAKDRDNDQVLEYAQKFVSAPGMKDGLYWSPELDGELSPLGPLAAQAQAEGYTAHNKEKGEASQPFHGYLFKIIMQQAKSAPGGKHDYIINDNMIAGFALVAWPASYGDSGIMTFIVNQQGRVFQKDLGENTAKVVSKMKAYDPDKTWTISRD
jgi:Protein of unknown function (DUF2950)